MFFESCHPFVVCLPCVGVLVVHARYVLHKIIVLVPKRSLCLRCQVINYCSALVCYFETISSRYLFELCCDIGNVLDHHNSWRWLFYLVSSLRSSCVLQCLFLCSSVYPFSLKTSSMFLISPFRYSGNSLRVSLLCMSILLIMPFFVLRNYDMKYII